MNGNTIIEVRPGEGGADAHAFALELVATLLSHLASNGHGAERSEGPARTFLITTDATRTSLEWISGTHRVQRIPKGSAARHTSTATIAILNAGQGRGVGEGEELGAVRVDRYRGSGPGGQHRNKVSTAIRMVHQRTGIVVTRESGRSQSANLADAERDLRQQLRQQARKRGAAATQRDRQRQVTADRSAKTFTHNEQRSEVVDHQTGRRWTMKRWRKGDLR